MLAYQMPGSIMNMVFLNGAIGYLLVIGEPFISLARC